MCTVAIKRPYTTAAVLQGMGKVLREEDNSHWSLFHPHCFIPQSVVLSIYRWKPSGPHRFQSCLHLTAFTIFPLTAGVDRQKRNTACIHFPIMDSLSVCTFVWANMCAGIRMPMCENMCPCLTHTSRVCVNILAMFSSPLQVFRSPQIPTGPSQLRQGHKPRLPLPSPLSFSRPC